MQCLYVIDTTIGVMNKGSQLELFRLSPIAEMEQQNQMERTTSESENKRKKEIQTQEVVDNG